MRKFMKFLLVIMCMVTLLSKGVSIKAEAANITSGTLGDKGGISWTYDTDTKTLTITGEDTGVSGYEGTSSGSLFRVKNICPDVEYINLKDCKLYNCNFLFANLDKVKRITFDNFDTSKVTSMKGMFSGCSGLEELDLSNFVTVQVTDISRMFQRCSALTSLDLSSFDTKNVTNMGQLFDGCSGLISLDLSGFNTQNVTNMSSMFFRCSSLSELDLKGINTSKVTSLSCMFYECFKLSSLDLSGFNTQRVTSMEYLFYRCSGLENLNLSSFDTSNVKNMGKMFYGCSKLTELDVSKFNTSNVTNMDCMFYDCLNVTALDVSGFDTSNVTNMRAMFRLCWALDELDVSGFDTSNVTDMNEMFYFCEKLKSLDVSGFVTSNVTDMSKMFHYCEELTSLDLSGFDLSKISKSGGMLDGCYKLKTIYVPYKIAEEQDIKLPGYFLDVNNNPIRNITNAHCSMFLVKMKEIQSIEVSRQVQGYLKVGESDKVSAKITPSDLPVQWITWKSDNSAVVTVDENGNVKAVGPGTAFVYATALDGSNVKGTVTITVIQPITEITLNQNSINLKVGEKAEITATVSPSNANNKLLRWKSSDNAVVTVDNSGKVTAVGGGSATITATAQDGSGKSASCIITVKDENPFADVKSNSWQYPFVKFVYDNNIMAGKGKTTDGRIVFDPDKYMTRAEFVQTLYNKEGKPAVTYTNTFTDVPEGEWYTNAILWAFRNGIVTGKGGRFDISGKITREEVATILYKYATNYKSYDTTGRASLDAYEDTGCISSWAENNMKWAIHYGIMKGRGKVLAPQDNASRAECATMLKNFMDAYNLVET